MRGTFSARNLLKASDGRCDHWNCRGHSLENDVGHLLRMRRVHKNIDPWKQLSEVWMKACEHDTPLQAKRASLVFEWTTENALSEDQKAGAAILIRHSGGRLDKVAGCFFRAQPSGGGHDRAIRRQTETPDNLLARTCFALFIRGGYIDGIYDNSNPRFERRKLPNLGRLRCGKANNTISESKRKKFCCFISTNLAVFCGRAAKKTGYRHAGQARSNYSQNIGLESMSAQDIDFVGFEHLY